MTKLQTDTSVIPSNSHSLHLLKQLLTPPYQLLLRTSHPIPVYYKALDHLLLILLTMIIREEMKIGVIMTLLGIGHLLDLI
jgi:hypothetical protein